MLKNRSRPDIWYLILEAAKEGEIKTRIMWKAMLYNKQVTGYISDLIEKGMLESMKGQNRYITTEKGRKFISAYEHMASITRDSTFSRTMLWSDA